MTTELIEQLQGSGYRMTGPRRKLCALLAERPDGVTAEELVSLADGVGRATVYRSIQLLVTEGLVCKLSEHGSPRYALASSPHHHHVVCVGCGQVTEFKDPRLEQALRQIDLPVPGRLIGHHVEFDILCPQCDARSGSKKRAELSAPRH